MSKPDEFRWGCKYGFMERTLNGTLTLFLPWANSLVLEIVDRFGQKIYPNPGEIDKQLTKEDRWPGVVGTGAAHSAGYLAGDKSGRCPHGLWPAICTICPIDGDGIK